jgi:hypothetical protein
MFDLEVVVISARSRAELGAVLEVDESEEGRISLRAGWSMKCMVGTFFLLRQLSLCFEARGGTVYHDLHSLSCSICPVDRVCCEFETWRPVFDEYLFYLIFDCLLV